MGKLAPLSSLQDSIETGLPLGLGESIWATPTSGHAHFQPDLEGDIVLGSSMGFHAPFGAPRDLPPLICPTWVLADLAQPSLCKATPTSALIQNVTWFWSTRGNPLEFHVASEAFWELSRPSGLPRSFSFSDTDMLALQAAGTIGCYL